MDEITIRELLGGQSDGQQIIVAINETKDGFELKQTAQDASGKWREYLYKYSHEETITMQVTKWYYRPEEVADDHGEFQEPE